MPPNRGLECRSKKKREPLSPRFLQLRSHGGLTFSHFNLKGEHPAELSGIGLVHGGRFAAVPESTGFRCPLDRITPVGWTVLDGAVPIRFDPLHIVPLMGLCNLGHVCSVLREATLLQNHANVLHETQSRVFSSGCPKGSFRS